MQEKAVLVELGVGERREDAEGGHQEGRSCALQLCYPVFQELHER